MSKSPRTSRIVGHFGSYEAAYEAVGKKYLISRQFSIQNTCNDYKMHPWCLIYYGKFY